MTAKKSDFEKYIDEFPGLVEIWENLPAIIRALLGNSIQNYASNHGKQQWNAAVDACAESARIKKVGNSGSYLDAGIDKESITKNKKV